jgi:hypothetical protein
LECWSVGVLECWSVGVLECWSVGVLEWWRGGVRAVNILLFMASVDDRETGMNAREFDVPGVKLILPKRFSDARGISAKRGTTGSFAKKSRTSPSCKTISLYQQRREHCAVCISKSRLLRRASW